MAEDAWIGDTHTKVGRLGSAHNLYESLPRATAAYLTLCNGRLSAEQCLQQGIVNRVVPKEKLIPAAEELAEMVCEGSPLAIQAAVRLYRLSAAFPAALTAYARHLDQETAESEDGAEGPRAFREKRKPRWTGDSRWASSIGLSGLPAEAIRGSRAERARRPRLLRRPDAPPGAAVGGRHRRLGPRRQPGRARRRLPAEVRLPGSDLAGQCRPRRGRAACPAFRAWPPLPAVPDQAIIAVPAESVVPVVRDCIAARVPAAVVWAGGFAETDAEGRARQRELEDVCRGTGLKLCGPNCIGIINTAIGLTASFSSLMSEVDRFIPGAVSIVSQSGGIAVTTHARAQELGFGFRVTISCGNEAVLGIPDFVRALVHDDGTRVIAVYTEGLSDPAGFVEALAEARRAASPSSSSRAARPRRAAGPRWRTPAGSSASIAPTTRSSASSPRSACTRRKRCSTCACSSPRCVRGSCPPATASC